MPGCLKRGAAPTKAAAAQEEEIPEGPVRLKRSDVVLFTEELSDMLAAGLQLEPALRAMENSLCGCSGMPLTGRSVWGLLREERSEVSLTRDSEWKREMAMSTVLFPE